MQNSLVSAWSLSLCLVLCASAASGGTPSTSLSDAEILALLPRGPDMHGDQQQANWRRLVALGEDAYPALCRALPKERDDIVTSRILGVFKQSKGDKAEPRRVVRSLLAQTQDPRILRQCASALAAFGKKEDAASMLPLLKREEEYVRSGAARALAKIGGEPAAAEIRRMLSQRRSELTPKQQRTDASLDAMEQALKEINRRLAGRASAEAPTKKPAVQSTRSYMTWLLASAVLLALVAAVIVAVRLKMSRSNP